MDIRRLILYAALALVVYSLWNSWQQEYSQPVSKTAAPSKLQGEQRLLPNMSTDTNETSEWKKVLPTLNPAKLIQVKTDVLNLTIDLTRGDIVDAQLLQYPARVDEKNTPFTLLQNNSNERYVAGSQLFTVSPQHQIQNVVSEFQAEHANYQLSPEQNRLVVTLNGRSSDGLVVQKQFILNRGEYLIDVRYQLQNQGDSPWKGYVNTQLLRSSPQEDKSSLFHVGSFTGASYAEPGKHRYKKLTFRDMAKTDLDASAQGGWVAMQQHYFLSAWVPDSTSQNRLYTRASDGDYTIGVVSPAIVVEPSKQKTIDSKLYVGPKITDILKSIAPGLDLTVDYGWLWFLSSLLFSIMKTIYSVLSNWGWTIVVVTLLIKLAFYRLSATSYKSMANMRKLQPKLQSLRERYGDDKAKISQATMELYRQEKVNPLGGCLPILIQIPVFIALYWVLVESVELRQAPFIFWIKDLSIADPLHILPLIMGITMFIQQKLNPAPPDPTQAKMMMFLPVLFTGMLWNFPAGLVLYWIVNNCLSILQQWYITHRYEENKSSKKLASIKS